MLDRITLWWKSGVWKSAGFVLVVAVLLVAVATFFYSRAFWPPVGGISDHSGDWGVFGDYIGGIAGSVIAGAALILLYKTVRIQHETLTELRAQRETTKAELQGQIFNNLFLELCRSFMEAKRNKDYLDASRAAFGQMRKSFDDGAEQFLSSAKVLQKNERIAAFFGSLDAVCVLLESAPRTTDTEPQWGVLSTLLTNSEAMAILYLCVYKQCSDATLAAVLNRGLIRRVNRKFLNRAQVSAASVHPAMNHFFRRATAIGLTLSASEAPDTAAMDQAESADGKDTVS